MSRPELKTTLLTFDEGFRFHGPESRLSVTVTTDIPVQLITHQKNRSVLADRVVLFSGEAGPVEVPDPTEAGWVDSTGQPVTGWTYDVRVTVTAPDRPAVEWVGSVAPQASAVTVSPSMGATPSTGTGGSSPAPDPSVSGAYIIS